MHSHQATDAPATPDVANPLQRQPPWARGAIATGGSTARAAPSCPSRAARGSVVRALAEKKRGGGEGQRAPLRASNIKTLCTVWGGAWH
jgi:hypothetical protein